MNKRKEQGYVERREIWNNNTRKTVIDYTIVSSDNNDLTIDTLDELKHIYESMGKLIKEEEEASCLK